jgi:hypothetical protein
VPQLQVLAAALLQQKHTEALIPLSLRMLEESTSVLRTAFKVQTVAQQLDHEQLDDSKNAHGINAYNINLETANTRCRT